MKLRPALPQPGSPTAYGAAVLTCLLAAALAWQVPEHLTATSFALLSVFTVFLGALTLGQGPATVVAVSTVLLFAFFAQAPRLSLLPAAFEDSLGLLVMLLIALITARQTARLRRQADLAARRERASKNLYALARDLAGATAPYQVMRALSAHLDALGFRHTLYHPAAESGPPPLPLPENTLETVATRGEVRERIIDGRAVLLLPLKAPLRTHGALAVALQRDHADAGDQRSLLLTMASLTAIALERLEYVQIAHDTQLEVSTERLRSSVLSALSHDLRTPLTVIVGLADSLLHTRDSLPRQARETATTLVRQCHALGSLMSKLLDMARLHAGTVKLRKEWHLFDDLISTSLRLLKPTLGNHPIRVRLEPDLPLLEFDAVLMERVLCNLLENAAKYAPDDTPLEISAFVTRGDACLEVADHGPGFPSGALSRVFELFERGNPESPTPGAGLGLSICRAIVHAHGGRIIASNREDGGASVRVVLPLGTPPAIEEEPSSITRPQP